MRRMITESDVEKLDSIKPSEMQKLAAMQDPKEAKANQVLTADGTGKAVYKDASGNRYALNKSSSGIQQTTLYFYVPDTPLPESVAGSGDQLAARVEVGYVDSYIDNLTLMSLSYNGTSVAGNLSADKDIIITYEGTSAIIYLLPAMQEKLNYPSSGSSIDAIYTFSFDTFYELRG